LSAYLKFWSVICFLVTLWLTFFKKEVRIDTYRSIFSVSDAKIFTQDKEALTEADLSIKNVYKTIWAICKLRRMSSIPEVLIFP
jgi:MFS transporter, PAT family, solute carrier family 33 (acetyl-CoA transportor), member 1